MAVYSNYLGYKAPSLERPESMLDADAARIAWAKGLREMDLRSLAVDYLRGDRSQACVDAYEEYKRRFPDDEKPTTDPRRSSSKSVSAKKSRRSNRSST